MKLLVFMLIVVPFEALAQDKGVHDMFFKTRDRDTIFASTEPREGLNHSKSDYKLQ
ncbi:MAG: hypothetical protein WKF87_11960 [Chryseolinea sp.]